MVSQVGLQQVPLRHAQCQLSADIWFGRESALPKDTKDAMAKLLANLEELNSEAKKGP